MHTPFVYCYRLLLHATSSPPLVGAYPVSSLSLFLNSVFLSYIIGPRVIPTSDASHHLPAFFSLPSSSSSHFGRSKYSSLGTAFSVIDNGERGWSSHLLPPPLLQQQQHRCYHRGRLLRVADHSASIIRTRAWALSTFFLLYTSLGNQLAQTGH